MLLKPNGKYKIKKLYLYFPSPIECQKYQHLDEWIQLIDDAINLNGDQNDFEIENASNLNALVAAEFDGGGKAITVIPLCLASFPCEPIPKELLRDIIVDANPKKIKTKILNLSNQFWDEKKSISPNM